MGKDPAFMLYSQDFLVGVSDLTMEERGQYITMLCLQHQKGHLTKKNIQISVGNVSEDVMSKFVQDENEMYYNATLENLMQKREAYSQSRSENGKKGGRPRKEPHKNQEKTICLPYAEAYENHTENENVNVNVIIFEYWNNKNIIKHRELTEDISKAIEKALKSYSEEDIKTYIDRYATVIGDKDYFFNYKWSLKDFLSRKDGISAFTDEGSKWVNYTATRGNVDTRTSDSRWAEYGDIGVTI
jgi:uncharacterized protein YdaU (DUF1376 family)